MMASNWSLDKMIASYWSDCKLGFLVSPHVKGLLFGVIIQTLGKALGL